MATRKEKKPPLPSDWNYEEVQQRVVEIVDLLERGDLPLDDAFGQFAVGVDLLSQCDRFLQEKEAQIESIVETLTGGANER
jgi:exodeoxyribonuclease VII small subunit